MEKLKKQLRKAGYKATPARLAVLEIMQKSRAPLNARDVITKVGKRFDPATVYRIFKDLRHARIIRQVDLRHNHAHYELAGPNDHHHLTCVHCGIIEDVTGCSTQEMYTSIINSSKNFAEIREHSLEFYGVCRACRKCLQ